VENTNANQTTAYLGSTQLFNGNFQYVSRIYLHPHYYMHPSEDCCLHNIANSTNLIAIGWGTTYEDNDHASETLWQVTAKAINSTSTWCKSIAYDVRIQFCAGLIPYGGKGEEM
jgi:hypothetical protein